MVKVREDHPLNADGEIDIERWLEWLGRQVTLQDVDSLRRACQLSKEIEQIAVREGTLWAEGSSSFRTGLEMAQILAELHMDEESLIAAILYRAVREGKLPLERVEQSFGKPVAKLIDGVLRMAAISSLRHPIRGNVLGQPEGQVDNIRRMLVTMIDDVRVALIKLAERTCAIRDVKNASPEKRHRVAREVFDIYAPLAHRLGIGHIKWELEDLSFRYLHEKAYKKIARLLDERRIDRQRYIQETLQILRQELDKAGIKAELSGRAKHIYSIWRKMHRKGIDFSQVYDVRAVRVLVNTVAECYAVLGIVHSLWRHIPHEFDDYIANPKENGYQSLHTAVIGLEGKPMEVQIRTFKMHEEAELGVCAHWLYKGTDTKQKSAGYEQKIAWLRQVLEWQEELGGDVKTLADQFRSDFVTDRVYVFTPEGHVVDLPAGATPIDFAYKVHTEVGHACRGAKVNGRIVPLNYRLQTGEQVQILTSNTPRPSRDWLNPDLGYVRTSRARAKITHWFKLQHREQNIIEGKAILEDELKRLSLGELDFNELARKVNYTTADDMYAAIGAGDLKPSHVANVAQQMLEPREQQLSLSLNALEERVRAPDGRPTDIRIHGVGNLMTQIAQCCQPVPGDPIIGYITVGRGVSIHRQDCINALQLQASEPNRIIQVDWGEYHETTYPVDIRIDAYDRPGLLRDITMVFANEKINLLAVNTRSDKTENVAVMHLTIEVPTLEVLGRLLTRIRRLPNVIDARRHKSNAGSREGSEG